jgi:hypothetical protein
MGAMRLADEARLANIANNQDRALRVEAAMQATGGYYGTEAHRRATVAEMQLARSTSSAVPGSAQTAWLPSAATAPAPRAGRFTAEDIDLARMARVGTRLYQYEQRMGTYGSYAGTAAYQRHMQQAGQANRDRIAEARETALEQRIIDYSIRNGLPGIYPISEKPLIGGAKVNPPKVSPKVLPEYGGGGGSYRGGWGGGGGGGSARYEGIGLVNWRIGF